MQVFVQQALLSMHMAKSAAVRLAQSFEENRFFTLKDICLEKYHLLFEIPWPALE